jgi:hypothetical protein
MQGRSVLDEASDLATHPFDSAQGGLFAKCALGMGRPEVHPRMP